MSRRNGSSSFLLNCDLTVDVNKISDEPPKLKHDEPGLLSMATADRDERGSLFSVTFSANRSLDRLVYLI